MKNLKSREQFLMEKLEVDLITEAGVQSNNAKWSETMIGKLFNWAFRVITLDGHLVDKFKDIFGAKSFIIKNLAKRLEKAIDALPGEYVKRSEEIDFKNLEMQLYDELYKTIEMLKKSKNTPIGKIHKNLLQTEDIISKVISELNPKDEEESKALKTAQTKMKVIESLLTRVKEITNDLTESEADSKTGYNLESAADKIGDKNEIKRTLEEIKASLMNVVTSGKDKAKISTESMFKIVSIMNKARDIYMEEDREGETIYRGNKRETMFKPNKRLFNLWEEKVLKILSRKSSIIPQKLLSYINNSLASVDPVKYNFEIEPGVEKNVLDELSDIDRGMGKVRKKFSSDKSATPVELISSEKSKANAFHFKTHEKVTIKQDTLLRGLMELDIDTGNIFLFNQERTDTEQSSGNDVSIFFVPTRTYINGMVLGVMSFNPDVFDNAPTTGGGKINNSDLSFEDSDFWRKDSHYYWGVLNKKDISSGGTYVMKIFNPGLTITPDRLLKQDNESLNESVVINKLEKSRALYGNDDKVAEIDKKYLEKKYNFNSTGYRSISQYFNSNKF